jgi:hypothetical protein
LRNHQERIKTNGNKGLVHGKEILSCGLNQSLGPFPIQDFVPWVGLIESVGSDLHLAKPDTNGIFHNQVDVGSTAGNPTMGNNPGTLLPEMASHSPFPPKANLIRTPVKIKGFQRPCREKKGPYHQGLTIYTFRETYCQSGEKRKEKNKSLVKQTQKAIIP